ncbi:MAG: ABC transporter ATP-binding protein, partial [Gemmatimonadetes bacterium]|nr:ABC transporter ATP-binding protein [Gemmatimonadota bacterium]
ALNRELGITIAIITHELLSIERLDGRLIMLDQGQVAFTGTVAEAKCAEQPVVRSFFHPSDSFA